MTIQRAGVVAGLTVLAAIVAWVLFVGLPRWTSEESEALDAETAAPASAPSAPTAAAAPDAARTIQARLFYLAPSGTLLQSVEREVAFGESPAAQARHILEAQLQPAPERLISAIPAGTKLRNLYLSSDGVAYVDLTGEVSKAHPGGSLSEILTVYSVVNALGENLPAVSGVQILIDGREVDTLAGHVDLRRPLEKSERWTVAAPATDKPAAGDLRPAAGGQQ
jgi:spore germination protein GerM